MDVAYDHIQGESFSPVEERPGERGSIEAEGSSNATNDGGNPTTIPQSPGLNAEFHQAFKAVSTSPWGSTLGGWWSTARKQGETIYQDLQKEATEAQEQASKGFSTLREQVVSRTRRLSLHGDPGPQSDVPGEEGVPQLSSTREEEAGEDAATEERPESLPADIVKEAGSLVASLRLTAASRLKDLQKAEDAADEALLKFGMNVRNFLRDAVTISAPGATDGGATEVLFETQEPGTGRKVFHSTRLDAQLHAIHTTATSFTEDPAESESWKTWEKEFDAEKETEAIAKDLDKYEELRRAMEKLVPEKVDYRTFWVRYYYLRKAIEEEERRRKEVLKGAATNPEEEISWDDDEDEEASPATNSVATNKAASESTTTLNASSLKPATPRRSHEDEIKSVADSDASYDMVSGATSRAAGSPKEEKRAKDEESDDDWE